MEPTYRKPQPVVVFGAVVAGLTTTLGTLTVIFKDNPAVMLGLGVATAVVGGAAVVKDQIVKGMVVPVEDTVAYRDSTGEVVTGPAGSGPDGVVIVPKNSVAQAKEAIMAADPRYAQIEGIEAGHDPAEPEIQTDGLAPLSHDELFDHEGELPAGANQAGRPEVDPETGR
jgi:hypothetical protein